MRRRVMRVLTMMGVVAATVAIAGPAGAGGGGNHCAEPFAEDRGTQVTMKDSCFTPHVLYAQPGDEITWTNRDPYAHVVAGTQWGEFDNIAPGERVTFTFEQPGIYSYTCYLHPGMNGTVVVGEVAGASAGSGEGSAVTPVAPSATPTAVATDGRARESSVSTPTSVGAGWRTAAILAFFFLAIVLAGGAGLLARRPRAIPGERPAGSESTRELVGSGR